MKHYADNPRRISEKRFARLRDTLSRLGDLSGIVHDLNSDQVIGGNQRTRALGLLNRQPVITQTYDTPTATGTVAEGYYEIDGERYSYRAVRWTEGQCREANIAANLEAGDWNFDLLAGWDVGELQEWGFDSELLAGWNLDVTNLKEMLAAEEPPKGEDPGAQIDKAEELREKWGTSSGQLWQLGEHRLVCGDCTDAEVVARVMGGEKAEMVWTDPPYGVAVGDKNKFLNSIAPSNRIEENLENDTLDEPELVAMLCSAFDNAIAFCLAGAAWFVAAPAGPLHVLFGQALKDRGIWRQTIQWVKNNATFAPMGVCYHWRAEPIFFGWLPDGAHRYYGGRKQDTVWEIDRPTKSPEHPTMKPVELVERAIVNHTKEGEIILDLFVGSGTTLIACERLGRKCRAVEISPAYCAVTIQRWADLTGGVPELVE